MIDSRSRVKRERRGNLGGREGRSGGGEKSNNGHTHTQFILFTLSMFLLFCRFLATPPSLQLAPKPPFPHLPPRSPMND